jgi:hypothetical protein
MSLVLAIFAAVLFVFFVYPLWPRGFGAIFFVVFVVWWLRDLRRFVLRLWRRLRFNRAVRVRGAQAPSTISADPTPMISQTPKDAAARVRR